MAYLTTKKPNSSAMHLYATYTSKKIDDDVLIKTPYGLAEGYFRTNKNIDEEIEWHEGKSVLQEGQWVQKKQRNQLPWPSINKSGKEGLYLPLLLNKLEQIEIYLYKQNSYLKEKNEMKCVLCNYTEPLTRACHLVLHLTVYEPYTEFRWPSIYYHYLSFHHVLPSSFFVKLFTESENYLDSYIEEEEEEPGFV